MQIKPKYGSCILTKIQSDFVKENLGAMKVPAMAKELGISSYTIHNYIANNNLKSARVKKGFLDINMFENWLI